MKFLGRFTKGIGIALIILFCATSILLSFVARDVTNYEAQELVSYASSLENKFYDFRMMKILEIIYIYFFSKKIFSISEIKIIYIFISQKFKIFNHLIKSKF